ncbi:MAG: protein-glutamate O-methyltransferase CheR [Bdellovibrionales bacterium]|nr:protein-glutamate O-methyltransferase CheR [Bdellovibrionales bacterium]
MADDKTIYRFFADYIRKELGIVYEESNYYQLEKRLNEICSNLDIKGNGELYDHALSKGIHGHFKQLLLDIATNNETLFFRDERVFKAIESELLTVWRNDNPNSSLFRLWSAASSFGQEPYSFAMLLSEYRETHPEFPRVDIKATDISDRALKKAKEAVYSQLEVQRGLPAKKLIKYFTKDESDMWKLKHEIRSMVHFGTMNLLDVVGVEGTFDMISCRNVLIYQKDDMKKEIIKNLSRYLSSGGYFLMGAAESLIGLSDQFEQVHLGGAVFYRKK